MANYKGKTEEENIWKALDECEKVAEAIAVLNLYNLRNPSKANSYSISEEDKARAMEILQRPKVREELIKKLSLKFTPEVLEEIDKIKRRHAEEWSYHSQIVYTM